MNLVLLEPSDFIDAHRVRLEGRRLTHVLQVHRASTGDRLRVGLVNGKLGQGGSSASTHRHLEMFVQLDAEPPAPLPIRLILAVPRPKVLNRTIAAAVSMGIREIDIINSWRVEKSYWDSPRLSEENLRLQSKLGLEQAGDTILPRSACTNCSRLLSARSCLKGSMENRPPRASRRLQKKRSGVATKPVVLAIGPEGGFIDREVETFLGVGFTQVSLGPRILRVEDSSEFLIGRLFWAHQDNADAGDGIARRVAYDATENSTGGLREQDCPEKCCDHRSAGSLEEAPTLLWNVMFAM